MTYGYQQGDSFGSHKQALGFDAGASEKMRAEAAAKEQQRVLKQRAKMQLEEVQRKYEHNKTEISHKEMEARRLIAEVTHAMREVQEAERQVKMVEDKEHSSKVHASDICTQIKNAQKEEVIKKKEVEDMNRELAHLENQISLLQQKANDFKRRIYDASLLIQKMTLQTKQLESQENKNALDMSHAKSEVVYKMKDLENKKRSIQAMDQKRMREIGEIQRLKMENAHLEMEIRQLEAKAK